MAACFANYIKYYWRLEFTILKTLLDDFNLNSEQTEGDSGGAETLVCPCFCSRFSERSLMLHTSNKHKSQYCKQRKNTTACFTHMMKLYFQSITPQLVLPLTEVSIHTDHHSESLSTPTSPPPLHSAHQYHGFYDNTWEADFITQYNKKAETWHL